VNTRDRRKVPPRAAFLDTRFERAQAPVTRNRTVERGTRYPAAPAPILFAASMQSPGQQLRLGLLLLVILGNRIWGSGFLQDTDHKQKDVPNASFHSFEPIVRACSLSFHRYHRAVKFASRCEPRVPNFASQTQYRGWMQKHSKYGNQSNHEL